nr:immunoglobulin heavy chain junction region [Mus musculus]
CARTYYGSSPLAYW